MKHKKIRSQIIIIIIFIVCVFGLGMSLYEIFKWKRDSNFTINQLNNINNIVNVIEIDDNENTEIIGQSEIKKTNPYWDYIKMPLISVEFNELKSINISTVGWIQVGGTNINYPVVQNNDNNYYLTHSFDKSYNTAGWVFMDYRNKVEELDKNTIIYAHGRYDKTMFGSLKNIVKSDWYNNSNNYIIKFSTEYENTLWQVISVYHIPTTSDYLQTKFVTNEGFTNFANKLIKRSVFNFNTSINQDDKILTLSTCYNESEKVVMHAKLIKKASKN